MANPELDQHFMVDEDTLKQIVKEAKLKKEETILEIGCGTGNLTKLLVKKSKVIGVEIDKELFGLLKNRNLDNLKVINGNVLNEITKIKFDKIVSNIPYNISEPLIKFMLKNKVELAVLVTGNTFYEKINSNNRLGKLVRSYYDVERLKLIKPNAFIPKPKTNSAMIKFKLKKKISNNVSLLVNLDNKKLKNVLMEIYKENLTKKETKEKIEILGSILEKKLWQLTENEFLKLSKLMKIES